MTQGTPERVWSVDVALTPDDWVRFSAIAAKRSQASTTLSKPLSLALTVGLAAIFVMGPWAVGSAVGRQADSAAFFSGLVLGVLAVILVARVVYSAQRRVTAGMVRPGGYLLGPRRMTLEPWGVRTRNDTVQSAVPWRDILDVSRHGDLAIIWLEPAGGHIVPRRAFADEAEFAAFVSLAQSYAAQSYATDARSG